jgi:glycosyltransferase involved in cell wall biosynthesis
VTSSRLSVSAVIPAYNRERYIADAIESVLRQTRLPDEIVVVDDASTDRTAEIVASFSDVRLIQQSKNSGTASARNVAIHAARGDVLAWLDSDDIWRPNHCETVVALLERHATAIVAYGLVDFVGERGGTWRINGLPADTPFDALRESFSRTALPMMATVTRRDPVIAIDGFDEQLRSSVDFDLFLRLARLGPFVRADAVTADYRWHADQISKTPLGQLRSIYASRRKMMTALAREGDRDTLAMLQADLLSLLERDLWVAWTRRELLTLRTLVEIGQQFDGTERLIAPFRLRRLVPRRAMLVWDRLHG